MLYVAKEIEAETKVIKYNINTDENQAFSLCNESSSPNNPKFETICSLLEYYLSNSDDEK
jgi:hypothetical protein